MGLAPQRLGVLRLVAERDGRIVASISVRSVTLTPAPAASADGLAGLGAIVGLMRTDLLPALTIDEAAARMGVGRKHVLELVRAGELRTILVGDRRIPAVFILEYYLRVAG